jgi:hypothetical protein
MLLLCPTVPHCCCCCRLLLLLQVWCMMACIVAGGAICLPVLLGLQTGNLVALFLLLPLMMGITGLLGGFNVSILPLLYPPGVRASGFNIGACTTTSIAYACSNR